MNALEQIEQSWILLLASILKWNQFKRISENYKHVKLEMNTYLCVAFVRTIMFQPKKAAIKKLYV